MREGRHALGLIVFAALAWSGVGAAYAQPAGNPGGPRIVDANGRTCTQIAAECARRGGAPPFCESRGASCRRSGTFHGNNFTIRNAVRR